MTVQAGLDASRRHCVLIRQGLLIRCRTAYRRRVSERSGAVVGIVAGLFLGIALFGCGGHQGQRKTLLDEISNIKIIDNHAHVVRMSAGDEPPDKEF
jgi:hypothetical protein